MDAGEKVWPMYFAREPLVAPRVTYKKGDQFLLQDKFYVRGLAPAYGIDANLADRMPFTDLPYVEILDVRHEDLARVIREQGLNASQARKLVAQGGEDDAKVGKD